MCTMDSSEPYISSIHFELERERAEGKVYNNQGLGCWGGGEGRGRLPKIE